MIWDYHLCASQICVDHTPCFFRTIGSIFHYYHTVLIEQLIKKDN